MRKKTIGIMGGMGPDATVDLFQKIIRATPAVTDQDHLRIIIDNNPAIPDRTRAILYGGESPAAALINTARTLKEAGADLLVMPCNTAHHYYSMIRKTVKIPMLHMMEETVQVIVNCFPAVAVVGLLATDGTVHSGLYHRALEATGRQVRVPNGVHQRILTEAIYGEEGIKAGFRMGPAVRIHRVASHLIEQGCELLIAGCTEIPLVLSPGDCAVPVLDPTNILAKAAVREAFVGSERDADKEENECS